MSCNAPVRFVPGQEGALQNAGRAALMMLLRGAMLAAISAVIGLAFFAGYAVAHHLVGVGEGTSLVVGAVAAWTSLVGCDALLVAVGAGLFRRFDVARDRG